MAEKLISKIPEGPLSEKWTKHKSQIRVVSPANKKKMEVIVVGTGLGGASAAASLGELGYNVKVFCISDSPRRAHSIAAQGGINAAKNYQNDNDSVYRLFYDTIKGGPVGANTIATAVGEDQGTLEEVYEPFLIKEGFIIRTPRGREATELAYRHLGLEKGNINPDDPTLF